MSVAVARPDCSQRSASEIIGPPIKSFCRKADLFLATEETFLYGQTYFTLLDTSMLALRARSFEFISSRSWLPFVADLFPFDVTRLGGGISRLV